MSTRKKKSKKLYFGPEAEEAIIRYNLCDDQSERSRIYDVEIKYAFEKLTENIIHTFKFYYTGGQDLKTVQHDVISFLIEKLPRFTADKGKAFSYFSIVAKNYLILQNNKNFKKLVDTSSIDTVSDTLESTPPVADVDRFINCYVDYWDDHLDKHFPKKQDRQVAAALVELFRKRENLEIFNKKALYIYIREMSNASTQQITKMVKVMKEKYTKLYSAYLENDYIPSNREY
tara:strand:+ start:788 stop:1480 length:693 start_codon:yes stop_codon:yes gene_type:complete